MPGTTLAAEFLGPPTLTRAYDATAADLDLTVEGTGPCRAITVFGSGTVVVTGVDGVDVTLPDPGGNWTHVGAYKAIKDTSTATSIVVSW
jgi:hypothetical protein